MVLVWRISFISVTTKSDFPVLEQIKARVTQSYLYCSVHNVQRCPKETSNINNKKSRGPAAKHTRLQAEGLAATA